MVEDDVVVVTMIKSSSYKRGDRVDCAKKDFSPLGYTWLNSTILGTHDDRNLIAVRYDAIPDRKFDEWVDLNNEPHRIAPYRSHAEPGTLPVLDEVVKEEPKLNTLTYPDNTFNRSESVINNKDGVLSRNTEIVTNNSLSNQPRVVSKAHAPLERPPMEQFSIVMAGPSGSSTPSGTPSGRLGIGGRQDSIVGDNSVVHTVFITWVIFLVNVGYFVYEMYVANWVFQSIDVNPMYGPSTCVLLHTGAKDVPLIQTGQWWRLFTPMIMHAGVIHLAFNMFSFCKMSYDLEREYGAWKIGLIYVFSGYCSTVFSGLFRPDALTVGASGAIFGLLGADWGNLIQNWALYKNKCSYFFSLFLSTVVNLGLGLLPLLDNYAHIGGLIAGLFLSMSLLIVPRIGKVDMFRRPLTRGQWMLKTFSFCFIVIAAGVGTLFLFQGFNPTQECKWCIYLSCVPNPYFPCTYPVGQVITSC